jgi:glycine hydroxymethyltransferase
MGKAEMAEVARFFARALLKGDDPAAVKRDVAAFRARFQEVRYCFNDAKLGGYPFIELAGPVPKVLQA